MYRFLFLPLELNFFILMTYKIQFNVKTPRGIIRNCKAVIPFTDSQSYEEVIAALKAHLERKHQSSLLAGVIGFEVDAQ